MSVRPVVDRSMRDESGVCTDDEGELEESKRAQGIRGGGEDEWGEEAEEEDGGKPPKLSASSPDDEALVRFGFGSVWSVITGICVCVVCVCVCTKFCACISGVAPVALQVCFDSVSAKACNAMKKTKTKTVRDRV